MGKVDQHLYRHYTDGIHNVFCMPDDCPEGYRPGMTCFKERKKVDKTGKRYFTDGNKNVFCLPENCPAGFHYGCTRHKKRAIGNGEKEKQLLDLITKENKVELFKEYYLTHSMQDCADLFNSTIFLIQKVAKRFGLVRDENVRKIVKEKKQSKIKNTCLERYGVENPAKSDDIKKKMNNTCLERYGVAKCGRAVWLVKSDCTEEFKKLRFSESESKSFLSLHNREFTKEDLCKRFNCSIHSVNMWIYSFNLENYIKIASSHFENEIVDYIKSLGDFKILVHDKNTLDNRREIDIYLPDFKIGIEFNGNYWHSSINLDKNYHLNKSLEAEKLGIHLIHIYEFEWTNEEQKEKIKEMLRIFLHKVNKRIYARDCLVKKITNKEASQFNLKNHLQGHRNAQVTYGLFYKDELVQLMSFSKSKYNKNIKGEDYWEIIRGCPGSNNIVIGGVSKLFKSFIREYRPKKVFSYCDFNKFNGISYEKLGMKFIGYTGPNKWWLMKDESVCNRNPSRYKELKENSLSTIWGAGSKKYLWEE